MYQNIVCLKYRTCVRKISQLLSCGAHQHLVAKVVDHLDGDMPPHLYGGARGILPPVIMPTNT